MDVNMGIRCPAGTPHAVKLPVLLVPSASSVEPYISVERNLNHGLLFNLDLLSYLVWEHNNEVTDNVLPSSNSADLLPLAAQLTLVFRSLFLFNIF